MELIPDSVYEIGSEKIYQEYIDLIKSKNLCWFEREKIANLLIKIATTKILKKCANEEIAQYEKFLDKFNNSMIDWINMNLKEQREEEDKFHKASIKIGRKIKIKIYEFYQ